MQNDDKIINNKENYLDINDKIIGNAIVSYFIWLISFLFLFNKTNKYINNNFVKLHTKNAIIIHLLFLITYVIFISNSLLSSIYFLWIWINIIITNLIFIWLLILLIIWIYKSAKWLEYKIYKSWFISLSKQKNILDITWDGEISEKEKITIILSFIPFIWFINFAKYENNETIKNWTRLNITISLIISLLYIFWNINIVNIFSLFYIIWVTFIWINLFTRNELIQIKLPKIFSPEKLYIYTISLKNYLLNYYFKNDSIINLSKIISNKTEKRKKENVFFEKFLNDQKDIKLPKFFIYIPIFNFIFLFFKNSRYKFHIINWILLSIIWIILWLLSNLWYINNNYSYLLIFPILFWISYINNNILSYRIPIIFDIYTLLFKSFLFMKWKKKILNKKRNEINNIHLKVQEKNIKEKEIEL